MPNFEDILNKPAESIEKPKPRPAGHYLGQIAGVPAQKDVQTKDGERKVLSFKVKLLMAHEDVDAEALEDHAELSTWMPLDRDIWIDTPEGEWALIRFLTETLEIDKSGKTPGQMCTEAVGKQLTVEVENYPYTNRDGAAEIGTRIKSTAKV